MCLSLFPMSAFAEGEVWEEETDAAVPTEEIPEEGTDEAAEPNGETAGADPEAEEAPEECGEPAEAGQEEDFLIQAESGDPAAPNFSISTTVSVPGPGQQDNDLLFDAYLYSLFYPGEVEAEGETAGRGLTGPDRILYDHFRTVFEEVAAGERQSTEFSLTASNLGLQTSWTEAELGVTAFLDEDGHYTKETLDALTNLLFGNAAFLALCVIDRSEFNRLVLSLQYQRSIHRFIDLHSHMKCRILSPCMIVDIQFGQQEVIDYLEINGDFIVV